MYPPVFPTVAASSPCVALLKSGAGPIRFYEFGKAPQGVMKPYAVWQRILGAPENYLGDRPDIDALVIQVDVYAGSEDSARTVAVALRDAIETAAYVTAWLPEGTDPDTGSKRVGFQSDWLVPR